MELSKAANAALLASAGAVSAPYAELAKALAAKLAGLKADAAKVKGEKVTVWDSFKSAIAIGHKAKHSRDALRAGLEIACVQAGIPAGSFRGYVSTVENLYGDLIAGTLTMAEVKTISVKDARDRYADAAKKALAEAKARLLKAVGEWSAEAITELAKTAEKVNEKAAKPAASDATARTATENKKRGARTRKAA